MLKLFPGHIVVIKIVLPHILDQIIPKFTLTTKETHIIVSPTIGVNSF